MLNKILRFRRTSHFGVIDKSYNSCGADAKQEYSNCANTSVQFSDCKSLTVNQYTGVKVYNSNGKKMGKKKGVREEGMKKGKKKEWEGGRGGEEGRRKSSCKSGTWGRANFT